MTTGANARTVRWQHAALILIAAIACVWVIARVGWIIAHRVAYPYDLEWMEGGMLHHSQRIAAGRGIYVTPSLSFISYLYTPLYPGVVALLGSALGFSYTLARAVSVAALLGSLLAVGVHYRTALRVHGQPSRRLAALAAGLAAASYASTYGVVEGWFDLARGDSLFLALCVIALCLVVSEPERAPNPLRLVSLGALLALTFFCKQTGVVFVMAAGALLLVTAPRRLPWVVAACASIGLGMVWVLQRASGGWFWTYAFELHQAHDFHWPRFWDSFVLQARALTPAMIATVLGMAWCVVKSLGTHRKATLLGLTATALGLGAALATDPRAVVPVALAALFVGNLLMNTQPVPWRMVWRWGCLFAVALVVGATGYGTQFAHFNAFMPAFLLGSASAGMAVVAAAATGHRSLSYAAAATIAIALWVGPSPSPRLMPQANDYAAHRELFESLATIEGDIWLPSHPWYAVLMGRRAWVHRMGIIDVNTGRTTHIEGLRNALTSKKFAAIVLDERDIHLHGDLGPLLRQNYRPTVALRRIAAMRSGARVSPHTIWRPIYPPQRDPRDLVLDDFERPTWSGWSRIGTAFGTGPSQRGMGPHGIISGYQGSRFASSLERGDQATGRLSRWLTIDRRYLTFWLSGGNHPALRVELRHDGKPLRVATPESASETMRQIVWDLEAIGGATAELVLVDDDETAWGHLHVDELILTDADPRLRNTRTSARAAP